MICYDRLWKTMEKKGISQYRLIKYYHFSAGQIGRLKKNMHVSTGYPLQHFRLRAFRDRRICTGRRGFSSCF